METVSPFVLALSLTPLVFSFQPETKLTYGVDVQFDGFLPLMGGNEGKVDIKMGVSVKGAEPDGSKLVAVSEITAFEVSFNGAKLPLDTSNVVEYFPKTTIKLASNGKILETDAPDKKLPIRLPGLDVKHFPDVTYVPIEFSDADLAVDDHWTFSRDFGGAPVVYQCTAQKVTGEVWTIKVDLKQVYQVLESPTYEVVEKPEDAVSDVTTTMTGVGTVEFDAAKGRVVTAKMSNTAVSDVKNIKSGVTVKRSLKTEYSIKLEASPRVARSTSASTGHWWNDTLAFGRNAVAFGKNAVAWLQTAAMFGLRVLPRELEQLRPYVRKWAPWIQ